MDYSILENYKLQDTTIWSFPCRGNWSNHNSNYRGNCSPHVVRNVILRYSNVDDIVLDQFLGGGTTAIETALLNRNFIGVDINKKSIEITTKNLLPIKHDTNIALHIGNARKLSFIKNAQIDLIFAHPPYSDIIKYSEDIPDDLSCLSTEEFLTALIEVAEECYRVLKPGKYAAILIGDIRKKGMIVPLGLKTLNTFERAGFKIKEIVIKEQHNCSSTAYWKYKRKDILMIAHEYLFVLKK